MARTRGINIVPVAFGADGVSPRISEIFLELLGADSDSDFRVDDDEELPNITSSVLQLLCPGNGDVILGPKLGWIGIKWDKSRTFSD